MARQFTQSCCGINVRTGTVVAGWVTGICGYCGVTGFFVASLMISENPVLYAEFIALSFKCALELVTSILLVYGASAERRGLVRPWLGATALSLVLGTALHVALVLVALPARPAAALLVAAPLYALAQIWFLRVVSIFYKDLGKTIDTAEATDKNDIFQVKV